MHACVQAGRQASRQVVKQAYMFELCPACYYGTVINTVRGLHCDQHGEGAWTGAYS